MSQESSLTQSAYFVRQVLTAYKFQQKLAATAKARPQSSNPSSRPSGHKFEAIQERLNRQVSHVDKVLRTDSQS
jgi:hypothetical protein